jgi:hypothetical protein
VCSQLGGTLIEMAVSVRLSVRIKHLENRWTNFHETSCSVVLLRDKDLKEIGEGGAWTGLIWLRIVTRSELL